MILVVKVCMMLRKGCVVYWCYILEVKEEEMKIEDIPVVCEFPDIYPKELPRLPPQWEIDFEIQLIPGAQPISIPPYQMAQPSSKS